MTYDGRVLALTRHFAKLSISPESSDGLASVGAILPKEEAALLPGGLFAFVVRVILMLFGDLLPRIKTQGAGSVN